MSTIDFFVVKKVEIKKSNLDFMSKAIFLDMSTCRTYTFIYMYMLHAIIFFLLVLRVFS